MARLQSRWMASDFYGPGVAVASHLPLSAGPWAPAHPGLRNALSGGFLPLAGDVPVVCAAAVATPEILDLMVEAGLPRPTRLHTFRDPAEYVPMLARIAASGLRLAIQHPHPPDEADPAACAVDPGLLAKLMDKAHLGDLFSPEHLLPRRILTALPERCEDLLREGPAVLKAATGQANGGGLGVRPVRTPAEAEAACQDLGPGPRWVLEAWEPFVHTVCVHTAALADGRAVFFGAAEQVFDSPFRHSGNWADAMADTSEEVARAAVDATARAAAQGYRGPAGFDVGFGAHGKWWVIDANFRLNASTTMMLLREPILRTLGSSALRLCRWRSGDFHALLPAVRRYLRRGWLVPLYAYDPAAGIHGGQALLQGIVCGESRMEIQARMAEMAADFSG
jgi:hypothetical protein